MYSILAVLALLAVTINADEFGVENYPNPRKGGFKECGMRSSSNVCDPYETLNESERYRINAQLTKFARTSEEGGNTFCTRKGTDIIFVIHNEASQQFADGLRQKWNLDSQCGRFGVIILSLNNRKMYGSFDSRSPINTAELSAVIATEEELLQSGSYTSAVLNLLKELAAQQDPLSLTTQVPIHKAGNLASSFKVLVFAILYILF